MPYLSTKLAMATSSHITLFAFTYIFLLSTISTTSSDPKFSEERLGPITITPTEKTTHLHFYFHDVQSGNNPTAVKVIGDGSGFGTTFIIDDALRQGPKSDSKIIGRAQGMYSLAAQNDIALLMVMTFVFVEGRYNGSSISVMGRNHVLDDVREMPIVGGSGVFRLAKGYALAHTVWVDTSGDATIEYNVFVQHL